MKVNSSKNFGEILKIRRKELGYTQKYLSEFSGFSVSFISDVENGKKTVELEKSFVLANLLGIDVELNIRG